MGNEASSPLTEVILRSNTNELKKLFLQTKNHSIIWHDPNIHSDENRIYINQLSSLCDIISFIDWNDAIAAISGPETSYYVITSGKNGELLTDKVSSMPNVLGIFVFCGDVNYHSQWAQKYSKVICVEKEFQNLLSQVTSSVNKWQRQTSNLRVDFPSFAPIFDDNDKSDMNKQHFYLIGLAKFTDREQAKADFLAIATLIYKDKHNMEDFQKNYNKYNMKSILNWYTKESFLYKTTNNCLRIGSSDSIQYCRLILKDLETAIKEYYNQKSKKFNGLLYRGAYLSGEEWQSLQKNIGKDIEMYGFLSTTKDKAVAVNFAQQDIIKKALITIVVPDAPVGEQGFAEVKAFSDFQSEEEVLFNVRSRFTILEATIEDVGGIQCRHLVLLYGRQAIRRSLTTSRSIIEISVKKKEYFRCCLCGLDIKFLENEHFFINIASKKECVCHGCVEKAAKINGSPLLYVSISNKRNPSNAAELVINVKLEGMVSKYNQDFSLSFYGYTCAICTKTSKQNDAWYYRCMNCQNASKIFCKDCFHQPNDCLKQNHTIVVETRPFMFWSEKMSKSEAENLKFMDSQLKKDRKYLQQAETFFNANEYAKAAQCYEEIIHHNMNSGIQMHPLWNNLGRSYLQLGNFQRSLECYLKSLELKRVTLGEKHLQTVLGYNNVGVAYIKLAQYKTALDYLLKSIEMAKSGCGEMNLETALSYSNVAAVYNKFGEHKKAEEYGLKGLEIRRQIFGDNHPETASSYETLGQIYKEVGERQKAIKYHTTSLDIYRAVYGEKHPETAKSYLCLGSIYNTSGEYDKAMEYFMKSLEVRKVIFGEHHMDVASCYHSIGLLYKNRREYKIALENQMKALGIQLAIVGGKHTDVAGSYLNIGITYYSWENYDTANEYYMKALEIYKTSYGEKNQLTSKAYNNIGLTYKETKKYDKALEYFNKSLEIRKILFGEDHSNTKVTIKNIEYCENAKLQSKKL